MASIAGRRHAPPASTICIGFEQIQSRQQEKFAPSDPGEATTAADLLVDPGWMANKVQHVGVQSLLSDYIGQASRTAPFAIGAALTLAANALARRPRELPSQLLARRALSGSWDNTLRLWDLETGAELHRLEGHERGIVSVTILPDGRRALAKKPDRLPRRRARHAFGHAGEADDIGKQHRDRLATHRTQRLVPFGEQANQVGREITRQVDEGS
jgi:hypothetical protein